MKTDSFKVVMAIYESCWLIERCFERFYVQMRDAVLDGEWEADQGRRNGYLYPRR